MMGRSRRKPEPREGWQDKAAWIAENWPEATPSTVLGMLSPPVRAPPAD